MKINENTLMAFSTSKDVPVVKEGWLWKKGEMNPRFQKRWFVLKGNLLFYFENKSSKEPYGVIILEGCIIELAEEDQERFGFKISFQGERTRVYHLGTEFQQTLVEWMKLLAVASHDYMKLMVYELEQKLIELESIEKKRKAQSAQIDGRTPQKLQTGSKTLSMSHSAEPLSQKQPSLATASTISSAVTTGQMSHSLNNLAHTRENPFNVSGGQQSGLSCMDLLQSSSPSGPARPTYWAKYHASVGAKIVADQKRWLQDYSLRNPLLEIT